MKHTHNNGDPTEINHYFHIIVLAVSSNLCATCHNFRYSLQWCMHAAWYSYECWQSRKIQWARSRVLNERPFVRLHVRKIFANSFVRSSAEIFFFCGRTNIFAKFLRTYLFVRLQIFFFCERTNNCFKKLRTNEQILRTLVFVENTSPIHQQSLDTARTNIIYHSAFETKQKKNFEPKIQMVHDLLENVVLLQCKI